MGDGIEIVITRDFPKRLMSSGRFLKNYIAYCHRIILYFIEYFFLSQICTLRCSYMVMAVYKKLFYILKGNTASMYIGTIVYEYGFQSVFFSYTLFG